MSNKEIDEILNAFQVKFGIRPRKPKELKVIHTNYQNLNNALGIGGIPKGKTTEIFGEAGTGKTLLSYDIIANAQKEGMVALYIDGERNFSRDYAKKAGIKLNNLLICTPTTGEIALQVVAYYVENDLVDLIVIDSLPSLISISELEESVGDYQLQDKMIGTMLKQTMSLIDKTDVTLLCLNQIRCNLKMKCLTVPFDKYLSYYTSVRIQLSKLKSITKWRKIKGYTIEANIRKNNYHQLATTSYDLMIERIK